MKKNVLLGLLWGVLICILLSVFGCKAKKDVIKDFYTSRIDSVRVENKAVNMSFSILDTTMVDELTTTIREFVFDTSIKDSAKTTPMIVINPDGSVTINHGLKMYKDQTQSRRNEKKGTMLCKDSTVSKNINTIVSKEKKKKRNNKKVERVGGGDPFKWWQSLIGIIVGVLLFVCVLKLRGKIGIKSIINR
ncbi:MAG: hypothetical protein MSG77_04895 [Prevotella sp.]|nr:hypothetical protein [Prevotella sp.]